LAYLGNRPAEAYSAFQKQDFSTSATTSYTLDHPVANQNEIALFINFVRQEPTAAYTASGTTLTLTSATASSDDMYCVYLGKAVQTVNPPSGSVGSSQVAASIITGQTAETSIATDDTVLIHDTSAGALRKMTRANFVSGVGGTNTPAFQAHMDGGLTIANTTWTKLPMDAEVFDTDGTYDHSSNYRFTPGVAGKYWVWGKFRYDDNADITDAQMGFYKNGSLISKTTEFSTHPTTIKLGQTVTLSASDYLEIYAYQNSGGNSTINGNSSFPEQDAGTWGAYRIII